MSYVCLKTVKYVRLRGIQKTFHPGDWLEIGVDVGKQTALLWVAEGSASAPHLAMCDSLPQLHLALPTSEEAIPSMGVVIRGGNFERVKQQVPTGRLGVVEGNLELPFTYTLLWTPPCPLRRELLPVGFLRLSRGWQLAVPLLSYEKLACNIGSPQDRALTEKVIPDLRIMLYDTRLVYIKRDSDTERLIEIWKKEPGDERLAFLRALFAVKPIICALPQKWVGDEG